MKKTCLILALFASSVAAQAQITTQPAARVRSAVVLDGSGTVAAANTSQQVFAANPARNFLFCENPTDATEKLAVNIGAVASSTSASWELAPGGSLTFDGSGFMPTGALNVTGATTGHRFICKQG